MVGLVKIYTALQRITTLTDNVLALCLCAFLLATICSYLALRSSVQRWHTALARLADAFFMAGLLATTVASILAAFTLAG
jgi:hypothetical protein